MIDGRMPLKHMGACAALLLAILGAGCAPDVEEGPAAEEQIEDPDEGLREALRILGLGPGSQASGADQVEAVYADVRRHGVQPDDVEVLGSLQAALLPIEPDVISPMMLVNTTLALASVTDPIAARAPLKDWTAAHPGAYSAQLSLGHLALVLQAAEQSELYFRAAIESRPGHAKEAYRGLGSVYVQTGRAELALEALDQAVEADAEDGSTHLQRGSVLMALQQPDDAVAAWRAAVQQGDARTRSRAHLRIGTLMVDRGDHEAALGAFERALEDDERNPACSFNLGQLLHFLNRPDEARPQLVHSIELRPDYPHAHYLVGEIDEDAGRNADAEQHYRDALAADPDHDSARYRLSLLLRRNGRAEEADRVAAGGDG